MDLGLFQIFFTAFQDALVKNPLSLPLQVVEDLEEPDEFADADEYAVRPLPRDSLLFDTIERGRASA